MASEIYTRFLMKVEDFVDNCNSFNATSPTDLSESLLETRLSSFEDDFERVRRSFENVYLSPDNVITSESKLAAKKKFRDTRDTFYLTKANILEIARTRAPHVSQLNDTLRNNSSLFPMSATGNSSQVHNSYLKVPVFEVHEFHGGYEEWPVFRDLFVTVIDKHPHLSNIQKLLHLSSKCKGEAHDLIKNFNIDSDSYMLAWDALKYRYENKRILIDRQLKTLFNIPAATTETYNSIYKIQSTISNCLSLLIKHGVEVENWDPILVYLCSTKLPSETLQLWEQSLNCHSEVPEWTQLEEFLMTRCKVLERISGIEKEKSSFTPKQFNNSKNSKSVGNRQSNISCKMCKNSHYLNNCPKYLKLSIQQRNEFVTKNSLCTNCLNSGHKNYECRLDLKCSCGGKHNRTLHTENKSSVTTKKSGPNKNKSVNSYHTDQNEQQNSSQIHEAQETPCCSQGAIHIANTQSHMTLSHEDIILPTAMVQVLHLNEIFTLRALIDSGSKRTFITSKVQKRLNLKTQKANFEISGLSGTVVANTSKLCTITLYSEKKNFELETEAIVVQNLTSMLPSNTILNLDMTEVKGLDLADPNFLKSAPIDMLVGSDVIPFINIEGTRNNIFGNLMAQNSIYGWYISGPVKIDCFSISVNEISENDNIGNELRKFWEQEEVPPVRVPSESDKYCEELYKTTTVRRDDGKYVVKLPFKEEFPKDINLGSSRYLAKTQYLHMEAKFSKNIELSKTYFNILKEYLELGHMKKCSSTEIIRDGKYFSYYLPHHAVFRPESASTKVRVVFNASRKTRSTFSLNDMLHTGPTLQSDLMVTILNWRTYKYVFNGDIEKMYRQIFVHESDRQFQRIVFRNDSTNQIEDYELSTVTFGVNCAPYLAIRTLQQLADDSEELYPLSSKILRHETYVDDILAGGHTLESARNSQTQLIKALTSAGFPLKKITANHSDLLKHIHKEDVLNTEFLKLYDSSSTKTLGIRWNALSDIFTYKVERISKKDSFTKRQVLSHVAKLFDPAGWLTPIIIIAKILMQEIWQDGTNWDEKLKPHLLTKWNDFIDNIPYLEDIQIPRWIDYCPVSNIQIHGFCDASEQAYCATLYIRSEHFGGNKCHLLVAKSKVAPLQKISLPRLELCGAVLLSKLIKKVLHSLHLKDYPLSLWTDSTIVLAWLQKHPSVWKTYVANRTTQIIQNVGNATWNHVCSKDNPSDLGTRGCKPQELKHNFLWWHGPEWLLSEPASWPKSATSPSTDLEQRKPVLHCLVADSVIKPIIERFSSYPRALAVIAQMKRFRVLTSSKNHEKFPPQLSVQELNEAKLILIKHTQMDFYPQEYSKLLMSEPISNKSSLKTLNPFLDEKGILRVNGRLANADLTYDERFPIILPSGSHLCKIFINFIHNHLMHADVSLMMNMIRYQFYIPGLKRTVKKCIHHCLTCTRYKQKVKSQIMAALPPERSTFSTAFSFTGVDFAGPFQIKAGNLRNSPYIKGYASIFVCFSTKAIHLEACSSLSSDAFLAAFARFISRRGLPKLMMSDNGTNFVGASKALQNEASAFLKTSAQHLSSKYAVQGFEWKFIPPGAPHMGGLWEAGVKSFKKHFKRVAGTHKFNFEEFSTLLARIESVLNSRPISPMSDDPEELQALTPGHFLIGAPLTFTPEVPMENLSLVNRWEKLKVLQHKLSQRWKTEYLHELHKRFKWKSPESEIKIGDFVVIKDELLPPCEWRMGRIESVHFGSDSRTRVAKIRTQAGIITRPIVKLCLLPIDPQQANSNQP